MTSEGRPIKVLYVINGLGTGGAERSLAEMLGPLARNGVEVTVACLYQRTQGVESEAARRHEVRFLDPGPWQRLKGLRGIIADEKPDMIHTTIFESDILGRIASMGHEVPVVTSIVNTSYDAAASANPAVSPLKLAGARAIDSLTARTLTDHFHALSEAAAASAVEKLGISRSDITVIPRGRDASRLGRRTAERRREAVRRLGLDGTGPVLLSVGRYEYQKGQVHAIEALALLRDSYASARLLIAGRNGAASESLHRRAEELGIAGRVEFLGHRDDVPELMAAADVLVFPSLYEGFGGTLVEAMALELPIVASDIPVLREVARDSAVFAPPGSPDHLADAVRQLVEDHTLARRLTNEGLRRFADQFSLDVVVRRMGELYRSLTDRA